MDDSVSTVNEGALQFLIQVGFQTGLGVLVALSLLFSREIRETTDFRFADIQISGYRLLLIGCGGFFITVILFFGFQGTP